MGYRPAWHSDGLLKNAFHAFFNARALIRTIFNARALIRTMRISAGSLVIALMSACGGGSGGGDAGGGTGNCPPGSAWDGDSCNAFAVYSSDRAPTPFVEDGQAITLEVVVYKPFGPGPFPAVMFNHGSTGFGDDPSLFTITYTDEGVARFFVERGWLIAFPQRRGRGKSGGLYDEGFEPDRSRYSCRQGPALAGFEHAMQDLDAAVDYLRMRTDVDTTRMLVGGISRGGILAIVHAAHRPEVYRGAFNFVGGWLGEGCIDAVVVNRSTFERGAAFPIDSLWMYGENDSFYSIAHSRANFDAFVAAGGQGEFKVYRRAAGLNGHFIIDNPALWTADLDAYVRQHQ